MNGCKPPKQILASRRVLEQACERLAGRKYAGVAILPLYARLPGASQGRVYSVHGPKIVVA